MLHSDSVKLKKMALHRTAGALRDGIHIRGSSAFEIGGEKELVLHELTDLKLRAARPVTFVDQVPSLMCSDYLASRILEHGE